MITITPSVSMYGLSEYQTLPLPSSMGVWLQTVIAFAKLYGCVVVYYL